MAFDISFAQYGLAVLYLASILVVAWYRRQMPAPGKRYTGIILAVLAVSAIGAVLQGAEIGNYESAVEADNSIPQFVDDTVAYAALFGLTGIFAGASRRMVALLAGLSSGSRIAIEVGGTIGGSFIVLGLLASFASYFARIYLLWWPVWRTAKTKNERRQLLYRKSRNILMFLIGTAIVVGIIGGAGLLTSFVQQFLLIYIDFFIRIAFVAFLISNIEAMWTESTAQSVATREPSEPSA